MTAIPNNLLSLNDSSFETSVAGWSAGAGVTVAQSATLALDGTKSMKGTASTTGLLTVTTTGFYGVSAGAYYTAYASLNSPPGTRVCSASILWFNASNVQVGATVTGTGTNVPSAGWTPVAVTALAPAGAVKAKAAINYTATVATDTFYVDQAALVPGSAPVAVTGGFTFTSTASAVCGFTSTAGDTLVALIAFNQNTLTTQVTGVTDTAGNVWVKATDHYGNAGAAGSQGVAVWTASPAAAVTSVTVAFGASVPSACVFLMDLPALWAYEASLVEFAASAAPSAAVTSVSSPISPNLVGDLLINMVSTGSANAPTNALGTPLAALAAGAGTTETQMSVAYQMLTTSGSAVSSGGTATSTFMGSATVALRGSPYIASSVPSQPLADTTLIAQGLTGYDTLTINRTSTLTGVSAPVRAANGAAQVGDIASVTDYEAPLGTQNQYTITASHANLDGSTTTAVSPVFLDTIPVVYGQAWLKNITQPTLSRLVNVVGPMADIARAPRNTTYAVLGTKFPVVVGDVLQARTGTLTLRCDTIQAAADLLALLNPGQVVLFQATAADGFPDMYFMVTGALTEKRPEGASSSVFRVFDIPFTEVDVPTGAFTLLPGNSWSQVLSFGSWTNVAAWRSTWLGVLNTPYGSASPH